jgi:hypothetical protein
LEVAKADSCSRHRALIAYLTASNLTNTAAALRAELGLGEDVFDSATAKKYEGLLEKKWTSVVRLQKKVNTPLDPEVPRSWHDLTSFL